MGECVRCLQHVAARRLAMTAALRTLPALDALLRQLTAAALGSAYTVGGQGAGPGKHMHACGEAVARHAAQLSSALTSILALAHFMPSCSCAACTTLWRWR